MMTTVIKTLCEKENSCFQLLKEKITENKHQVIEKALEFAVSSKHFALFTLDDDLLMRVTRSRDQNVTFHIGFPFPLVSRHEFIDCISIPFLNLDFYLRGQPIREVQKKYIQVELAACWDEIDDISQFRKKVTEKIFAKNILYVDPYTFAGDSLIGLHFLENFIEKSELSLANTICLSDFSDVLSCFVSTIPKNTKAVQCIPPEYKLVIIPDLIDIHLYTTIKILKSLSERDYVAFVVGRDLIVSCQQQRVNIIHFNRKDVLLKDSNIEDYMNECLSPFVIKSTNSINIFTDYIRPGKQILINPFGSIEKKYLPVDLVISLLIENALQGHKFRFKLVGGFSDNPKHLGWYQELFHKMENVKLKSANLSIEYFTSLSELAACINAHEKFAGAISADTSISHLINLLKIPAITVYNSVMWDEQSIQSLTSDSPLGFCRYSNFQLPALNSFTDFSQLFAFSKFIWDALYFFNGNHNGVKQFFLKYRHILQEIINAMDGIVLTNMSDEEVTCNLELISKKYMKIQANLGKTQGDWLIGIYNPASIVKGIIKEKMSSSRRLVSSAIRISPLYKLRHFIEEND